MKHFEPQYNERGDPPVDLSGREGAPRAEWIDAIQYRGFSIRIMEINQFFNVEIKAPDGQFYFPNGSSEPDNALDFAKEFVDSKCHD